MNHPFVSGLLLAAGMSSRYGRLKQLQRLGGMTLVERGLEILKSSRVDEVVLVLGHAADRILQYIDPRGVRVVINSSYASGLSSSLRAGLSAADSRSDAVLICLADQPFMTVELLNELIARFARERHVAVAASSRHTISPPMIIPRSMYAAIAELRGDKGAKALVLGRPGLRTVDVEPEVLLDVDNASEMLRAREVSRSRVRAAKDRRASAPSPGRRRPAT